MCKIIPNLTDYSSGGETDWMYAVQNVSLAYAVEFRDKGICWPFELTLLFDSKLTSFPLNFKTFRTLWISSTSVSDSSKLARIHWWTQGNAQRSQITTLLLKMSSPPAKNTLLNQYNCKQQHSNGKQCSNA